MSSAIKQRCKVTVRCARYCHTYACTRLVARDLSQAAARVAARCTDQQSDADGRALTACRHLQERQEDGVCSGASTAHSKSMYYPEAHEWCLDDCKRPDLNR